MNYDWKLFLTAHQLRRDRLIAHATESVIGLATSAYSEIGFNKLFRLKNRKLGKNFLVIAANLSQVLEIVDIKVPLQASILDSWPGAVTWILPASKGTPLWLISKEGEVAIRMTAHKQASKLCELVGPLVSTSANPAAKMPAKTLNRARRYFGDEVCYYLPGQLGNDQRPSKIIHGIDGRIIRE
jgi:L-threonylcarbamoyladenylate synthase